MSYAGPISRDKRTADISPPASDLHASNGSPNSPNAPRRMPRLPISGDRAAVFGAGLAIGLAIGASAALLLAPQSGEDTRHSIARGGRRIKRRGASAWDDLRFELGQFGRQLQRRSLRRRAASSL